MTISSLWPLLRELGLVERCNGEDGHGFAEVCAAVEGLRLSVDLSPWIVQAVTQPRLTEEAGFSREGAVAKARPLGTCRI